MKIKLRLEEVVFIASLLLMLFCDLLVGLLLRMHCWIRGIDMYIRLRPESDFISITYDRIMGFAFFLLLVSLVLSVWRWRKSKERG